MDETEGNPKDPRPDSVPPPEPPKPSLDEPPPEVPEVPREERLGSQVPLGLLFIAAGLAIAVFLALVGVAAYFALAPSR